MNKKQSKDNKDELRDLGIQRLVISFLYNYFNLLIIFIVFLILIFGLLFIVRPKFRVIKNNITVVNQAQEKKKNEMDKYLNKLKIYKRNFDSINESDRNKINIMLPQGEISENVIAEMENIVVNKGMILQSLDVKKNKAVNKRNAGTIGSAKEKNSFQKPESIGTIDLSANITGVDYRGIKMLLDTFEKNLRILDISKISFSPGTEVVTLDMSTYYLKEKN